LSGELFVTVDCRSATGAPKKLAMPPPLCPAVLPLTVELFRVRGLASVRQNSLRRRWLHSGRWGAMSRRHSSA
jgi:hypothetical protein